MSESSLLSVGQILHNTRETRGVSLESAAARLRLMQRQVEAMETDDFESLGPAVFARGFVSNYARFLELAPEPLLARMQGAPTEPSAVSHAAPPPPHSWLSSPWLILLLLGLLVVVVAPVTLYWWLNSEEESVPDKPMSSTASVVKNATPAPDPLPPVEQSEEADQSGTAPGLSAAPAATQFETPSASASMDPGPPAGRGVLRLEFGDEAWVEIKDGSGRMLHRQLNPAGRSVDLSGQPPFDVVIGNASQVRVTYNGRPIDLTPFIAAAVARFTLEE